MKLPLTLLFPLACLVILPCRAQDAMSPSLNIGDPAPQLRLRAWLKGRPFQQFEALQAQIDHFPYPGIRNFSKDYHTMADWYRRGGNRSKALEAERKATPATR